jgi:CMP-N-acetylneuraminic acid synthetase
MTKVLGIIPARGGSKRLPNKNFKDICGEPLINWSIYQAEKSKLLDRFIVNTDSREIAIIARGNNADVPFLRESKLAQDKSSIYDVIFDTLERLPGYDVVALLEPTSPLRKDDDIDKAIQLLLDNYKDTDSVVSVGEIQLEDPYLAKYQNGKYIDSLLNDGTGEKTYFPYGVIYLSKVEALKKYKTFYQERTMPYFIERWQNYEIDDMCDFLCVKAIMEHAIRNNWIRINGKTETEEPAGSGPGGYRIR